MDNILIIIDGILSKHFLERLCFEKGLKYYFDVIYYNDESINLNINNEYIKFHKFDPTSNAKLENLFKNKEYKQVFIYMENEFDTKNTYENLRHIDAKLEITIMDFWGLSISDDFCFLVDSRAALSRRLLDFLPNVALTAQFIGLGVGEIMEVKIPAGSVFAYRHIGSIQQKKWRIALIYRNNKYFFVKPSFMLQPNDSILIVGEPAILQSVFQNINKDSGKFPIPFGNNIYTILDMKNMSLDTLWKLLNASLTINEKINNKKLFIKIINPTLNEFYEKIQSMIVDNDNIFFDYQSTNFSNLKSFIEGNDVGLFITDSKHFEKEKKQLFDLKIPILKIGDLEFDNINESIILNSDNIELENQSNVMVDISKQLDFKVKLYHYGPNQNSDTKEYFQSLSRLHDKKIEIIDKKDENPIIYLSKRSDVLQFVLFEESIIKDKLNKSFSMNFNELYYKLNQNYQLFIPTN